MKKKIFLAFIFSLTLVSSINSQTTTSEESFLLTTNLRALNQYHFIKKPIDESFFSEIFDNYLKEVDSYKIFFIEAEIEELSNFKIPKESLESLLVIPTYTEEFMNDRIALLRSELANFFATPFDFTIPETFNSDYENLSFARSEADLLERWRKRLKYQILSQTLIRVLPDTNFTQVQNSQDETEAKENLAEASQDYNKVLSDVTKEIESSTQRLLSTLEVLKKRDYVDNYINAIGRTYDEYTSYLPPIQKETFDIRLSGQLEGIGAEIRKSPDGLIEVVRIVPGGASYRQKELQAGDKIMKVAQDSDEAVDIQNLSLNEVLKLIRGKKGTLVRLTVKKKSGEVVVIPIVRDKILLEETYARSAILDTDNKRYGYIYLPKFYRNFNDELERTSTDDVRKELDYLNEQKVEGLVFDLRNNGGGSLEDAILMSGLFITEGPITRVRDNSREYPAYQDKDKNVVFSEPIIVLVNGGSASASEIFSAALQDYERAVIVGEGEKTFGKGTVQTLFSLNKFPQATSYTKDLGYLKFTIQKYYRITGESTQTQGVRPDIILPSTNILFKQESAFTNDSLRPTLFSKWNQYKYPLETLSQKNSVRINANPTFVNIQNRSHLIKQQQEQKIFPLQYAQALEDRQAYLNQLTQYKIDLNQKLGFNIIKKTIAEEEKQQSGFKEKLIQKDQWYESLTKDIYIQEALEILNDILSTS